MRTTGIVGSLLVGIFVATVSHLAFAHDATKPDVPYHQIDLPELHAIVETVRESAQPEQLAKIDQLVSSAGPELYRLSQRASAAHRRKVDLMLQDVVDRHAFEKAQADELEAAAALSNRIDDALTGLAKALTPQQRLNFRLHNNAHQN